MKKVMVTGASGMLGSDIVLHLQKDKRFKVFGTGRKNIEATYPYYKIDLLNYEELNKVLNETDPDVIIHCAANVNLNDCEINKEYTDRLHVGVTQILASYKPGICRIIYISTDSVFDGTKGNYIETDAPAPLNYYALSKLQGEQKAAEINSNSLILRTNIYGFSRYGQGSSLFEWVQKNLNTYNCITGFSDVCFNPLYTVQVAEIIIQLLFKEYSGLLHLGCEERISKYDFALLVAKTFEFERSLVKEGNSDEIASTIKRPRNTTLNSDLLNKLLHKRYSIRKGLESLKADYMGYKNIFEK